MQSAVPRVQHAAAGPAAAGPRAGLHHHHRGAGAVVGVHKAQRPVFQLEGLVQAVHRQPGLGHAQLRAHQSGGGGSAVDGPPVKPGGSVVDGGG